VILSDNPEQSLENKVNTNIFTEKEIANFSAFCEAMKKIHVRLINEGYDIKDGAIFAPPVLPANKK
jgi:hypothetical protein